LFFEGAVSSERQLDSRWRAIMAWKLKGFIEQGMKKRKERGK